MNKKRLIVTSVISIILVSILFIGATYSIFTTSDIDETENVYTLGNLSVTYTEGSDNVAISSNVPVSIEDSVMIKPYRIHIENTGNVPYKFDVILADSTAGSVINYQYIMVQVGKLEAVVLGECTETTVTSSSGSSLSSRIVKEGVVVPVGGSVDVDVRVWLSDMVQNTEINKSFYAKLAISGVAVYDDREMIDNSDLIADYRSYNVPNLDTGLIPVYYDESDEVWKRADSTNNNYSWYDYDNKRWANAVLVSDSTKRNTYLSANVGTTITDDDITAFYVWIPRFKYRVWNITRQGGAESTYAYPAYTNGIDIEFEKGTGSTGNVECTYNVLTTSSTTTLVDVCVYNGTDTITTTSGNANYTDAWYTHPAFTFGDKEIEGFWIGKFETSGTASSPTIKPDLPSLMNQTISIQFTTSKKFQGYGLSDDMDAHMLTNLEWGAVAYLTHSIYGLCDGSSCRDVYINNSSSFYTGRSGGAIAGATDLNLANVYPENSTATTKSNTNGYYTYKGYFIDYNGNVTATKDESKVASTTGNITGVYDLSGGRYEYVMGNVVDSSGAFYPSSAGTSWNGSTTLDSKYYNSYSYFPSSYGTASFNRARLGDATAESIGGTTMSSSWKPGSGVTGSYSYFVYSVSPWFYRGGYSQQTTAGSFYFDCSGGGDYTSYSFRSSLS